METKEIVKADEQTIEKNIQEFRPNPAFVSAGSMLPKNYSDVMQLANIMCKSNIVPKEMIGRPEACAVAVMFGLELGLSPTQAIQNIMIVNGRPSLWGDAVKALVMASGKCELFDEDPPHKALEQGYGRCHLVRKKEFGGGEVEIRFSIADAERAGLWKKTGPWTSYPGRMLMFRPRGWACRDLFGDVLKGMQMREELEDYEIIHPAKPVEMPRAVKTPQMAQDATLIKNIDSPVKAEIAQQAQTSDEITGSAEDIASGDAQEPALDPEIKIEDYRRKQLFKLWTEKKINPDEVKAYMKENFGIEKTADLTNDQADKLTEWILVYVPR